MKFQASFVTLLVVVSAAISVADAKADLSKRPANLNRRDEAAVIQKRGLGSFASNFWRRHGAYDATENKDADDGSISNPNPKNDGQGTQPEDYTQKDKKPEDYNPKPAPDGQPQPGSDGNDNQWGLKTPGSAGGDGQGGTHNPWDAISTDGHWPHEGYSQGQPEGNAPTPGKDDQGKTNRQKADEDKQKKEQADQQKKDAEKLKKDQDRAKEDEQKAREQSAKAGQQPQGDDAWKQRQDDQPWNKDQPWNNRGGQMPPKGYNQDATPLPSYDGRGGYPQPGSDNNDGYPQPGSDNNDGYPQPGSDNNDGYPQPGSDNNDGYPQPGSDNQDGYLPPDAFKQSPIPVNSGGFNPSGTGDDCPKFPKKDGGNADWAPCFAMEANRKDVCSALKQFGIDTQAVGCLEDECEENAKDYSNHACNSKKQCDFGWKNDCDFYRHMGFSNVEKFGCGAPGTSPSTPGDDGTGATAESPSTPTGGPPYPSDDYNDGPQGDKDGSDDCEDEDEDDQDDADGQPQPDKGPYDDKSNDDTDKGPNSNDEYNNPGHKSDEDSPWANKGTYPQNGGYNGDGSEPGADADSSGYPPAGTEDKDCEKNKDLNSGEQGNPEHPNDYNPQDKPEGYGKHDKSEGDDDKSQDDQTWKQNENSDDDNEAADKDAEDDDKNKY